METPSSTRRATRSQAFSAIRAFDSGISQKQNIKAKEDRCALIDITNDSPIVGLAMQTPPSGLMSKRKKRRIKCTPGSGEALLRGQVKTLLHKVEQGTEFVHSIKTLPFIHLVTSPMRLLALTPANTPQVLNFTDNEVQIKIASPIVAGQFKGFQEELEDKSMSITRSLMLDFTDKSASCEEEEEEVDGNDGLCEGMKKMSVETTQAEFTGIHSRFVYNSDDEEIVEVKQVLHFKLDTEEESSSNH